MSKQITSSEHPPEDIAADLPWVQRNISSSIVSVEHTPYPNAGGLHASMSKLKLNYHDHSDLCVLKLIVPAGLEQCKNLGLARESLFYESFATTLISKGISIPNVVFTYGNLTTGEKVIILQEITESIQCGYFYGPGSPLNWGKDLATIIQPACLTMSENEVRKHITTLAVKCAARLHGSFWKDTTLLSHEYLGGSKWIAGNSKESWVLAQNTGLGYWAQVNEKIKNGTTVKWDPFLLACMEESFKKISWDDFCESISSGKRSWTLTHGDYHPANMMWKPSTSELFILDWEMVGLGNGPQDIAQYLISHSAPSFRKEIEDDVILTYYNELVSVGTVKASDYSFDQCKEEYVSGGVGRWVWMLALLGAICPDNMTQYFHDQTLAFILDHGVNPSNIAMPRV